MLALFLLKNVKEIQTKMKFQSFTSSFVRMRERTWNLKKRQIGAVYKKGK